MALNELFTVQNLEHQCRISKSTKKKNPKIRIFTVNEGFLRSRQGPPPALLSSDSSTRTALLTVGGNTEGLEVGQEKADVECMLATKLIIPDSTQ